ncbi:Alpha/Beta hydrolase protein, partial [Spinellus fusiger]
LKQMVNPFWTPPDIIIYPNITYATLEEIVDVVTDTNDYHQPKKFTLDIYASKNRKYEEKRPVMIHIHGGAWKWGNKDIFYPHAKYLVSESNWASIRRYSIHFIFVNIEYRTAPRHPYPAQLINIKRAIRWVKQSIRKFGGDPDCIVLSGDSSGGHLASMAGLTINDPFYQPGFESVDTSIMGVVSLYGVLDLQTAPYMTEYFAYAIAMQKSGKIDYDFINRHSPIELLQECNDKGLLVPFLLVHAQNDIIDTPETGKRFKLSYDKINSDAPDMLSSECKIIVLPEAHHYTYILWSPRSLYVSKLIQIWCEDIYNRQHKKAQ